MITFGRMFKPVLVAILAGQVVPFLEGGLRVAFTITKTLDKTPDVATCSFYNLAPERRIAAQTTFSELGRARLSIRAGYDGIAIDLFAGDIRRMQSTRRVGPDVITEVRADDGGDALADVNAQLYGADVKVRQMVDVALAFFAANGHPITKHPSVDIVIGAASPLITEKGWSTAHNGKATDLLDQAARLCEARWFVRGGFLHFAARNLPLDGPAVIVERTHWLSELDEDGSGLARLSVLMDPNIEPGRPVVVQGMPFRVEAATYAGDTESGPWSVAMAMRRVV